MIKNIEEFMELDNLREELLATQETYQEVGDLAYSKAVMCIEEDNLIAYGFGRTWLKCVLGI